MGQLPSWYDGRKIRCAICAFWYGERSGKISKQRGLNVCYECRDTLTQEERLENIQRRR